MVLEATKGVVAVESRPSVARDFFTWVATLFAFPLAGLAARGVAGPVDAVWSALRRWGADVRWIAATAVGLAIGLGLAFAVFGYGDSVGDLAVVGGVSGLGIGFAQAWLLRDLANRSLAWVWVPATAASWALGWTVTTTIGVDPDDRWAVPGLSGAATVTVLLGAVLWILARSGSRARTSA